MALKNSRNLAGNQLEEYLIEKLRGLNCGNREDIRNRAALEKKFREKCATLNRVNLSDGKLQHLLNEIIIPDVFTAAKTLRVINDGTPLIRTLININDWCRNSFEVVSQLRFKTDFLAAVVCSLPFLSVPFRGGFE